MIEGDREAVIYTSRELIDLCVDGHYLLNDAINATVSRIYDRFGMAGKERMYTLPSLPKQASEEEVRHWQRSLLKIERELSQNPKSRGGDADDSSHLKLPWS